MAFAFVACLRRPAGVVVAFVRKASTPEEFVVSIGQTLAAARRDAGLSIDDISAKTRLRATVVRAIEADDFSLCGGDFYARGHIRTLAGLVGADPVALLADYDANVAQSDDLAPSQIYETEQSGRAITRSAEKRSPHWGLAAVSAALVAIIVYFGVSLVNGNKHDNTAAAPPVAAATGPSTQPVSSPSASPVTSSPASAPTTQPPPDTTPSTVVAEAGVHVVLRITSKCWVAATASNGQALYQGILNPGDTKTFDDPQRIDLRLGNAPGTDLTVNGVDIGSPPSKTAVTSVSFGPGNPLQAQG
jgi:cytoskeleton protein RodZ